jgi:hypothetical protein
MMVYNDRFAWETLKQGHFQGDLFPPIDIPVILQKPWVQNHQILHIGLDGL